MFTAAALTAGGVLAAGAGLAGWDPTTLIGTVVTPVVMVLLFITGWIVPKQSADELRRDLAAERAAREALARTLTEDVVPALVRSTDAMAANTAMMQSLAARQVGGG